MKIIVLGAAGQVGSLVCNAIKTKIPGAELLSCARNAKEGFFKFDPFADNWQALGQADVIINAVGAIGDTKNATLEQVHIGLAEKLIQNRPALGYPRIIHISALGAEVGHKTRFLSTKGAADELLKKIPCAVIVRPSIIYTPDTMLVTRIKALFGLSRYLGGKIPISAKMVHCLLQPIDANDFAEIMVHIILNPGFRGVIELGGEKLSLGQIMLKMAEKLHKKIQLQLVPEPLTDMVAGGILTRLIPSFMNAEQYTLLHEDNVARNNQAARILGRKPLRLFE